MRTYRLHCAALLTLCSLAGLSRAAALPQLNVDAAQTTVSGISSGGYMAVQLHVAYSAQFQKGAAAISGGPYDCADNSVMNALLRCLGKTSIPVADLIAVTDKRAREGLIDPTSNLAQSKVYVFAAAKDSVVNEATSAALAAYYAKYVPTANITFKKDIASDHGFITDDFGMACLSKTMPFIVNCGFDLAGAVLQNLYGPLQARAAGALSGQLIEFDQTTFGSGHGLGELGWVYVPKNCGAGATCRVHIALHGCRQNGGEIGDVFARNAGYNRWADNNNLVVLYPQTGKGATNGCWDWWGYGAANYAIKEAPQMKAIVAMLKQLSRGAAPAPAKAK